MPKSNVLETTPDMVVAVAVVQLAPEKAVQEMLVDKGVAMRTPVQVAPGENRIPANLRVRENPKVEGRTRAEEGTKADAVADETLVEVLAADRGKAANESSSLIAWSANRKLSRSPKRCSRARNHCEHSAT